MSKFISNSIYFTAIFLIVICSSFDLLVARGTLRAQRQTPKLIRQSNPQLTRTIGQQSPQTFQKEETSSRNLDSDLAKNKKQNLSYMNQKFHEFTNALFRYDAQMATVRSELAQWQQCLSINFEKRSGNCTDLTDTALKQKIELLNIKIDELTEDKNRIVTLQDAFKKYWYVLIPIFAAGGAFAAHAYMNPTITDAEFEKRVKAKAGEWMQERKAQSATMTAEMKKLKNELDFLEQSDPKREQIKTEYDKLATILPSITPSGSEIEELVLNDMAKEGLKRENNARSREMLARVAENKRIQKEIDLSEQSDQKKKTN